MSKDKSVIVSVQHRGDPIEYRPHAHHVLHVADDTFDLKYSSFLWCESLLQEIRRRSFDFHASSKLKELTALLDKLPSNEMDMALVQVAHLQSTLSDPDRNFLIQRMTTLLSNVKASERNLVFAYLNQSHIPSCHDALVEIATDLSRQNQVQSILRKLPARVSSVFNNDQLRQGNPIQFITHLMSLFTETFLQEENGKCSILPRDNTPTLIITVPFFERLPCDVMVDLVQSFTKKTWRTLFLVSSSDFTTSRIYYDEALQANMVLNMLELCSPTDLYNQLAAEILPTNKLPCHFPSSIIRSLHNEFTTYTFCSSTFLKRLLAYIEQHFTQRKALLCMSTQWEWLRMMNISKKAARVTQNLINELPQNVAAENRETFVKAISELLSYLDKSDIQNTKLLLSESSDVKREKEIESTILSLTAYQDFRMLSRVLFTLLESLRDFLLPNHHKTRFCSALMWAGIMDKTVYPKPSNFLREFQSVACDQMPQVPLKVLCACTRDLHLLVQTKLIDQIESSQMVRWLKVQVNAIYDLKETFEMVVDLFDQDVSPMNMSFQKIEALASGQGLGKKISVQVPTDGLLEDNDTEIQTMELDKVDIVKEMISDFSSWLTKLLAEYAAMSSNAEGLNGVMYISQEIEKHTADLLNGNLRRKFMSGLLEPIQYLKHIVKNSKDSTEVLLPDVCHLAEKVRHGQPLEIAHGWMDHFSSKITSNAWDLDSIRTSKKRTRKTAFEADVINLPEAVMNETVSKGRFINAVYDIEKSGIITSKKMDRGDVVISKQIYTGI